MTIIIISIIISEGYRENASLLSEINVLTKEASWSIQMPCPKAHHHLRLQREPPTKASTLVLDFQDPETEKK